MKCLDHPRAVWQTTEWVPSLVPRLLGKEKQWLFLAAKLAVTSFVYGHNPSSILSPWNSMVITRMHTVYQARKEPGDEAKGIPYTRN
jgi:hypothetical protein